MAPRLRANFGGSRITIPNFSPAAARLSIRPKASAVSTVTFAAPLKSALARASAVALALPSTASTFLAEPVMAQVTAKPPE